MIVFAGRNGHGRLQESRVLNESQISEFWSEDCMLDTADESDAQIEVCREGLSVDPLAVKRK
eukprot:scaffold650125_cov52-Prasinocladus_malaysianus.AAC.1